MPNSDSLLGRRVPYTDAQVAHVKRFFIYPHHPTAQPLYLYAYKKAQSRWPEAKLHVRALIGHVRADGVPRVLNVSFHAAVLCEVKFDAATHSLMVNKHDERTLLDAVVETMNLKLGGARFVAGRMEQ